MANIDDKVVSMSFESSKFEQGVNATLAALDKLKAALKFDGATKGLDDLNKAGQQVDLSHIGKGIDDIKSKFGALSVAALAVFANIAQHAVSAGAAFVKSFTLDPIIQGFQEYATTLNSVQTILANTQASGATLKDVNSALQDLNRYSDKTIYNFSQMAKNIGTFTAAGVDLKTSTEAIKGIANLAALSGSSADQAATAMYQLSQAISAGQVHLQDWNSVVNAGMGGTVFQRALATTAENMGLIKEGSLKLVGPMKNVSIAGESFRQSLQSKTGSTWLTSKVLTNTLKQFTGDLTDAQLKADGFNAAQIKAIQQTAITAQHAATEVKTLSQVLDVAKETAGSGWAQTWQIIFGNFGEAKTTFTALSNAINGFINKNSEARNKVLEDWKALGGRTVLINAIKTTFQNLSAILQPIKEAFRDIFPATTGKDLIKLTYEFKHFATALKPGPDTINNLKRTFAGLFAILDIGKQLISGIFTVFAQLFGSLGKGSSGFLNFTGSIGDFLVSLDKALKKGDALHNFFVGLASILKAPIQLIEAIAHALSGLFAGISPGGFLAQIGGITKGMTLFQKITTAISGAWDNLIASISGSGSKLQPIFDAIAKFFKGLGTAIGQAASGMNFEVILQTIRTGLLGGLFIIFKNFTHQLTGGFLGGGIIKNISSTFQSLSNSMQALQHNIQADTLKKIAIAVGILTLSIVALSLIDPDKLKNAMIAIGFAFGELLAAMKIMDKITTGASFIKLPFIAASLILLAGAIDILSISVIALSRLSWNDLLKGLTGVGVLLGVISAASIPLSANSAGMVRAGIGIAAMAVGLRILASAVGAFADMKWSEMIKGLTGVGLALAAIATGMQVMPKGMAAKGVGILVVAGALKVLAGVVQTFAGMDWRTIGKGLAGVGGALVVIAGAMQLMPSNMVVTAAGLFLVSVALGKISDAVQSMGGMSIRSLAKGLIGLAGSLTILAAALYAMSGTFAGAAALALAAGGLALFIPALVALGKQSWGQILKGLITLAGALTILGVAGLLITPVIPSLLGLGAALILIGAGLALAGAGIALIGLGLSALVVAAPTGVAVLVTALEDLVKAIPEIVQNAVTALLAIVKGLAIAAPQFVDALAKILNSLIDVIIKESPKIAEAFSALLTAALKVLHDNEPKIIQAGFDLLLAVLNGIKNNIGQVVTAVTGIITTFLTSIASNLGKIITTGAQILTSLLRGIASMYAGVITAALSIITSFISTIANNLGKIATAGLSILTKLLSAIAGGIASVVRMGTDVIVNFIVGVGNAGRRVVTAGTDAIIKLINGLSTNAVRLANAGAEAIVAFLNGVAAAIETHSGDIRNAGFRIGVAIADGMTGGLASKAKSVADKAADLGRGALGALMHATGVKSPSVEAFKIGQFIVIGLANGMAKSDIALISASKLATDILGKFNEVFKATAGSSTVMGQIGQTVGTGFAQGIRGSTDDITGAFGELNSKVLEAMSTAKSTIATEQGKLDDLLKAKKPDLTAIKEAQKTISENELILKQSTIIHNSLITTLRSEGVELLKLSTAYDGITEKLKTAQDVLASAIQTRDSAVTSFTDQFSTLPDLVTTDANGDPVDQLGTYIGALTNQANAVASYQSTLDQLRKLGLDDATYQKLLSEGTADQQFATQLLAGGKTAVDGLNTLDTQLQNVSKTLATNAAKNLYQAGVDAAQGIVKGLESQKSAIRKTMEDIAQGMLAALKKELKQKSPSQEMAEIGMYAMAGLAKGVSDSSSMVTDAIDQSAKDALTAMKKSMSDISQAVTDELNPNPVITPILDLSLVQDQAKNLVIPITAAASFGQASTISSEQTAAQADETVATPIGTSVKFEQNNYSPEALTEIEIYRQTRNQLSQLKSVLA